MILQNAVTTDLPRRVELYRLSVDQYHKMIAAGIFTSDDKLELLDGYLVCKDSIEIYRLSIDQYHQTIAAGVFAPHDKLELMDGHLIAMNPVGDNHLFTVDELYLQLQHLAPKGWKVYMQHPIKLADSEPEPDLVVVRGTGADYKRRKPGPQDVGLLVEVADTSLLYDRVTKLANYAAAGISEYWIVNLLDRQIEVHQQSQPARGDAPATYAEHHVINAAGSLPFVLDGKKVGGIQVEQVLP
jgi:Uma2 family endonuclease